MLMSRIDDPGKGEYPAGSSPRAVTSPSAPGASNPTTKQIAGSAAQPGWQAAEPMLLAIRRRTCGRGRAAAPFQPPAFSVNGGLGPRRLRRGCELGFCGFAPGGGCCVGHLMGAGGPGAWCERDDGFNGEERSGSGRLRGNHTL